MAKRFVWGVVLILGSAGCGSSGGGAKDDGQIADFGPITVDYGGMDAPQPIDFGPDAQSCNGPSDCDAARPYCEPTYRVCVECLGPADCVGKGFCLEGTCQLLNCQPGAKSCIEDKEQGSVARVCTADGQRLEETVCGWDLVCYEGACLTCRPGSVDCPLVNKARFCLFDGSGWNEQDCGDQRCFNGQCGTCVPGQRQCQGSSVMACAGDGSGYVFQEDCDTENTGRMCHLGMCINLCEFNAKFKTNNGCEYWAVDLDQYYDSSDTVYQGKNAPFAIVVSNTNQSFKATVTVSNASGVVKTVQAPPKQATIINLPSLNIEGSGVTDRAYRLTSTLPIVAYQFNPLENVEVYSNDASLLIPTNALGKRYIVMSWPTIGQNADGQQLASMFTVIAVEEGETTVEVTPTAAVAAGTNVPAMTAGSKHTWTLTQGQVLNIEAFARFGDLTGSSIVANKRVAVFGGHVCANAPVSLCKGGRCSYDPLITCTVDADCPGIAACDHLEEQLPPVSAWGKRYIVPKTQPRGKAPDVVRVLAAEDGTVINVLPASVTTIPSLNRGQFHEFEILQDIELSSEKPFLVGQFLEGQNAPGSAHSGCYSFITGTFCELGGGSCQCSPGGATCSTQAHCSPDDANIGDPSFMVGVSLEQFRNEYVFLVPPKYRQSYITVIARKGATVTLNGSVLAASTFKTLPTGDYMTATMPMFPGSHTMSSSDRAGLLVYGWDWYVSYGYPGGMNVEILQVFQ